MGKNKELVHIGISGGGFSIPGLAGAVLELLQRGIKPDVISGISSGSILTFILCASCSPKKTIIENSIGFSMTDVFSNPPFNNKGKLTLSAICNGIFHNYLSKQDKLPELLKTYVSEEEWLYYINDPSSPDGIIMSVDMISGARIFNNLKDYNYDDAITLVQASSSIPVFVNPVLYEDKVLVDGGVRNHILTEWIFDNYNIKNSYSIFSRAKDFSSNITKDKLKTTAQILLRTIKIMENEISKSDEMLADLKSREKGINHYNFHIKNILDNVYEDDPDKQKELFEQGRHVVCEILSKNI